MKRIAEPRAKVDVRDLGPEQRPAIAVRMEGPRPKMDVRDLELVLALARAGSTVRAAATLHITQSAISRGLTLAEDKLGVRLFERSARGLVPTPAGERLIAGAGSVLAGLVELE